MKSEAVFLTKEDTLSVILPSEIDHHAAKPIRERMDTKLFEYSPKVLIMDFSAVSFMDSSGIGLILGRAAKAEQIGAKVNVIGLCTSLRRLICMSGMERIANIEIK